MAAPLNPSSAAGARLLKTKVTDDVAQLHPGVPRHEVGVQAGWAHQVLGLRTSQRPTAEDIANYLDKANVYATRGRLNPKRYLMRVLLAMHEQANIQEGTHYIQPVQINRLGKPCRSVHNKTIGITSQGTFALVGFLISDPLRVQFLNLAWDIMQTMYRVNLEMSQAFANYKADAEIGKVRRGAGVGALLQEVSAALSITADEANKATLQVAHRKGYTAFFRGQGASAAMRSAKLLKKDEKPGVVHRLFSNHALIADEFRLSTMALALSFKQDEIGVQATQADKKRSVKETIEACTNHFIEMGHFDIPGASKTQQTKAFFEPTRVVRRRTSL